jgi:molybdate transport system substrate-binding protein
MATKFSSSTDMTTLQVLSAGAIEPGLLDAARAFTEKSGHDIEIAWATTPMIRDRIARGVTADLLIVPPATASEFAAQGRVDAGAGVALGKVGVGVASRDGAPRPDLASAQTLKRALLEADSIVINRASSGLYMETLLDRLGVKQAIEPKLLRIIDGPRMMQHIIHGKGYEFGFCASVEIVLFSDKGLKLAGLLPPDIQFHTPYAAVPMRDGGATREFLDFLDSDASRALFRKYGIE